MFDKIQQLKLKGYQPDAILDIGAHHGKWTDESLKIYNEGVEYLLFEAIPYTELERHNTHNRKVFNVLLNDAEKEVDWYELRNTGDSMFKELNKPFENCAPIKKISYPLDKIVYTHNLLKDVKHIFIKIDCQGAEIPILKGAPSVLGRTDFIILEMPFFGQYNAGVPTFLEHIQYMDSIGFIPYDICGEHNFYGFKLQVDVLFINKRHEFNRHVQEALTKGC
jgi:FkbM family methyltransferase